MASGSRYDFLLILLPHPASKQASKQASRVLRNKQSQYTHTHQAGRFYGCTCQPLAPASWATSRSRHFPGRCDTRKSGEPADSLVLILLEAWSTRWRRWPDAAAGTNSDCERKKPTMLVPVASCCPGAGGDQSRIGPDTGRGRCGSYALFPSVILTGC